MVIINLYIVQHPKGMNSMICPQILMNPEIHSGQDRKEYRDVICRMKEKLLGWFQETVDTVPKSMDSRFTEEKIWASLRNMVPPEKEDEVRQYIREEHPTIMQAIVKVMRSMIS